MQITKHIQHKTKRTITLAKAWVKFYKEGIEIVMMIAPVIVLIVVFGCMEENKRSIIRDQQHIITSQNKKINRLKSEIQNIEKKVQNMELQQQSSSIQSQGPQLQSLGIFEITAYCPCPLCSSSRDGTTATGTTVTQGRTIGVNFDTIPRGTKVMINGHEYIAEDTGSAAIANPYLIDIYMDTHQEAIAFGRQQMEVFIST